MAARPRRSRHPDQAPSTGSAPSREGSFDGETPLEENAAATEIDLTSDEVAELEAAVPEEEVVGERYAPANMKTIDR